MRKIKILLKRFRKRMSGQGMVEYAFLLALISVVAMGSIGDVGGKIEDVFDNVKNEVIDETLEEPGDVPIVPEEPPIDTEEPPVP